MQSLYLGTQHHQSLVFWNSTVYLISYNSVKNKEIKAPKSTDLLYEDSISREFWNFVHEERNSIGNLVANIMPNDHNDTFGSHQTELKGMCSQILGEKIN